MSPQQHRRELCLSKNPFTRPLPLEPGVYVSRPGNAHDLYPRQRQGVCVAAAGPDGKEFVVVGEGLKSGTHMNCYDRGNMVDCEPAS
jgi:hypothetical protein